MSEKEEKIVRTLKKALDTLPPEKAEYLIGYAEGVAAMAAVRAQGGEGDTCEGDK